MTQVSHQIYRLAWNHSNLFIFVCFVDTRVFRETQNLHQWILNMLGSPCKIFQRQTSQKFPNCRKNLEKYFLNCRETIWCFPSPSQTEGRRRHEACPELLDRNSGSFFISKKPRTLSFFKVSNISVVTCCSWVIFVKKHKHLLLALQWLVIYEQGSAEINLAW